MLKLSEYKGIVNNLGTIPLYADLFCWNGDTDIMWIVDSVCDDLWKMEKSYPYWIVVFYFGSEPKIGVYGIQ